MQHSAHHEDAPASDADAEPLIGGWLALDVVIEAGDWAHPGDVREWALPAIAALAAHVPAPHGEGASATLALTDDAAVRGLNGAYRGKDKPTNVLSFPAPPVRGSASGTPLPQGPVYLGDVVFANEPLVEEARDLGIPFIHHAQHLLVHGLLHLIGHDHETDAEAARMEGLETAILAAIGVPDPYAAADAAAPLATKPRS